MSPRSDNAPSSDWREPPSGIGLQSGGNPATIVPAVDSNPEEDMLPLADGGQPSEVARITSRDGSTTTVHDQSSERNHSSAALTKQMAHRDRLHLCIPTEHAIARMLSESEKLETAASRLLEAIGKNLGWETGALWSVDRHSNVLRCVTAWTSPSLQAPEFVRICRAMTFPPGAGLAGRVWSDGQPVWIADIRQDPSLPHVPIAGGEGLHSALAFPIRMNGEVLGAMEFFGRDIQQPDAELLGRIMAVGSQFGQFAQQKQTERALLERDIEMRLAQKIQQDLLPRTVPRFPGFKIGNVFRPARKTGGDFLDFVPLPDRSWVVAIGDASGHGVEAALLMAQTRAYLRALALGHTDVGKMLTLMNRRLVEDTLEEHYVTLFLARVLPESRSLVYSNAGHLPGFLLDAEGRLKKVLPCTGIPLGLDSNVLYLKEAGIAMQNGDRLLLFTDGVSEARDADHALFGVERAVKAVRNHLSEEPDVVVQALLDEVRTFTSSEQLDDQTAMLLQVDRQM